MEFKISDEKIHQLEGAELKDICIKGVFNNSVKVNTDVIGYPIQLFNKEEVKEKGTEKIKKKWSLKAIILNDLERFTRAEKHLVADQKLNAEKLAHSQLLIGSKYYSVVDNGLLPIETHIDFTSRGYIIRQLQNGLVKNITALSPIHDYDGVDLTLIVPSLFPNYMDEQYMFSLQSDAIQSRWKGSQTNVESTLPVNVPPTIPMNTTNIEPENPLLF